MKLASGFIRQVGGLGFGAKRKSIWARLGLQSGQLGQQTNDLTRLFAFEWKQAANTITNADLLSTTDVVDAAPGLSLAFNRTFYQSIAERYNLGSLVLQL